MRKLKLLLMAFALLVGGGNSMAETDYTDRMPSAWTGSTGDFQGGKELYQGANYTSGQKVMYQSFEAPATGIYEIKFYAVTSSTSGRGFDNIYGPNIAQAYAKAGENKATVAMEVINQTGCTLVADANIRTLSIEATEGETIEYGLENIAVGGNWYTIKELSAKMKTVAEIFQAQYDEAFAIWEHSTENEVGARATFKTYVDALNTAMSGSLAAAQTASDNLAAALVTYESKSYPVKGSGVKYDFTSKMNMAINAWTCKQGNGPAQYGFTGATETYGNTGAGKVMYQTISGLANGEYEIHFYAVANAANGGGVEGTKTTVYANDQELEIDVIKQSSCTPSDYERTFTVMVTDGTIEYGFNNTVAAGNWYICKNVALYMTGAPDLSDYYDAIAAKLTTANGLKSSPMNSTVLTALQDAIDATDGYTEITVIGTLETMSANLTTAINNANTSIGNYEEASSILNAASSMDAAGQDYYAADETVAAIQLAYDARTLEAVSAEDKATCAALLPLAARQQTSANADWTAVIVNPSFETGSFTGWTNSGMQVQNNTSFAKVGTYYVETWQPNGIKSVTQTVENIPAGIYSISAKAYARDAVSAKIFAAGEEQTVTLNADANTYTFEFLQSEDGSLTFGYEAVGDGTEASWICVDDFSMRYVRAKTEKDYLATAISAASRARKTANEGTEVFQIPVTAGATLAAAISVAQSVYDDGNATSEEITTAISTLNAAVATYEATTLNAPAAGTRYNIKVATAGHAKKGNAIIIVPGATSDNNPSGYGLNANFAPNANLAQAVEFTQVSGNDYTINFVTAEGTAYLTYGVTNGSTAGHKNYQIQATTDASKKGEFTIVATSMDNVFNIVNKLTNTNIDCQAGGNIYTDETITLDGFSVTEASQASVGITIASDVKYATRIFPFTPTLPEGVKAYSCAGEENGVLTLVEVVDGDDEDDFADLAANTPYILESTADIDEDITGWGTAASLEAKTVGLLTGVYEEQFAPVGSYVLQNLSKVAFYLVAEGKQPNVKAYRCYLTESEQSGSGDARDAFFFDEGEATAIDAISALTSGEAQIFNAAGAQLPSLQKGMNILQLSNGKSIKVMVK